MKLIFITIFLLFTRVAAFAQSIESYDIKQYTDENGLPQNSVKSLAKDENGFLWLTTEDGLVRFDGSTFKSFNKINIPTSTNRFGFLSKGWDDGKLYAENADIEYFVIKNGNVFPALFKDKKIEKEIDFRDSTYWSKGLWDTDRHNLDHNKKLKSIKIPVSPGLYYKCYHNRIIRYHFNKIEQIIPMNNADFWEFFTLNYQMFYHDKNGTFLRFANGKANATSFSGAVTKNLLWTGSNSPIEILWNINNAKNLCIKLGNLLYLAKENRDGTIGTRLILENFDFNKNKIISILFDEQTETIWMGSVNNGLFRLSKKQFVTLTSNDKNGSDNVYYSQASFDNQSVLTPQGFVLGINDEGKSFEKRMIKPNLRKYTMLTDSEGFIWREADNQLFKTNHQLKVLAKWNIPYELTNLYEGKDGWIYGFMRDQALIRMKKTDITGYYEVVSKEIKQISYIEQPSKDNLLLGTANGLYWYNLKTLKISQVPGLEKKFIRSIYCPKPYDKIWITTYGDGFYLLENGKLTQFPLDQEKYLATSHSIIEDRKEFFWITTNKGLFRVLKKDLISYASKKTKDIYYQYFNKENGFNSNEFNGGCQPCAMQLANGFISLPSMNGLVFFNPEKLSNEFPDKKLFIDQIEIDNKPVAPTEKINLENEYSQLAIHISTPYYGNRTNVQIQYSMTGNKDWFSINADRIIFIPHLHSGQHTLQIRKLNGFGSNNYTLRTIQLTVLPAWYEMWWVRILAMTGSIILIFLFVKWRTKSLKVRNMVLETRINDRTESLQLALETLQVSQNELQRQMFLYERLIGSIGHDIRTPLIFLTRSVKDLFKQLENQKSSLELIDTAKANWEFSERLLNLTNNLLNFIKSWLTKNENESVEINLNELVKEKTEIFFAVAQDKKTEIINDVLPGTTIKSHPGMVSVILFNLIDNAIKATRNGKVVISDSFRDGNLHLKIADTGFGMDEEIIDWINEFGLNSGEQLRVTKFAKNSGLGLILVIELAAIIKLKILAEANQTSGTTVHIIFPKA